jgi:hypothetical protein
MYNRLIIFLLRKKFGLKKYEGFRFTNQKSKVNAYYFTDTELLKEDIEEGVIRPSNVKLAWLLDERCHIVKAEE